MERFLMNPRRIAKFTQQIGACTDSADTPTPENDAMPTNSSIVDLAERHNDGLEDATPANALDVFTRPFAYAPGAP